MKKTHHRTPKNHLKISKNPSTSEIPESQKSPFFPQILEDHPQTSTIFFAKRPRYSHLWHELQPGGGHPPGPAAGDPRDAGTGEGWPPKGSGAAVQRGCFRQGWDVRFENQGEFMMISMGFTRPGYVKITIENCHRNSEFSH